MASLACVLCGARLSEPELCPQCGSLEGLDSDDAMVCAPVLRPLSSCGCPHHHLHIENPSKCRERPSPIVWRA